MTDEAPGDPVVRRDRFSGGPARGFLSSLAADERIFAADLAVDRAHVVMLAEQGIVTEEDATAILAALESIEAEGFEALPDGEDVHEAIETAVVDRIGAVGGRMHTARSRNDEVAACIRLRLREDLLDAVEATLALRRALQDVAEDHVETVMPGYTHRQPAQPTTLAHHLLSYESQVARDTDRLLAAVDRTNRSPLGAAAFAGTPFAIDRDRTAELLGFDGLVEHSMDAVTARDFLLESAGALAALSVSLAGLSADLIAFVTDGFVDLDDDYASTSSIMPQKKNPDTLELVRATAGDAAGTFQGILTTLKGLPRAYNRDLQRATPHIWAAVDDVAAAVDVAAGAIETASWNEVALEASAGEGFATATAVADRLAMAGLPFRTAHEIVAMAANEELAAAVAAGVGADGDGDEDGDGDGAEDRDGDADGDGDADENAMAEAVELIDEATASVTGKSLSAFVDPETIAAALDPANSVAARDSKGGPAPAAVAAMLDSAVERIEADERRLESRWEGIEAAGRKREEVIERYV
ncbi:MAG: argininosuccinate lyase [Halodesulfurarchaeum sp.]